MTSDESVLRTILVVVGAVLLLPILAMLLLMPMMGAYAAGHMGAGGMWEGTAAPWLWSLVMLVPLILVVGVGYLLYRALRRDGGTDRAMEELRLAYARGELSDEEFEERRDRLQQGGRGDRAR